MRLRSLTIAAVLTAGALVASAAAALNASAGVVMTRPGTTRAHIQDLNYPTSCIAATPGAAPAMQPCTIERIFDFPRPDIVVASPAQSWAFQRRVNDSYEIVNNRTGLCLGGDPVALTVDFGPCDGSDRRRWHGTPEYTFIYLQAKTPAGKPAILAHQYDGAQTLYLSDVHVAHGQFRFTL